MTNLKKNIDENITVICLLTVNSEKNKGENILIFQTDNLA